MHRGILKILGRQIFPIPPTFPRRTLNDSGSCTSLGAVHFIRAGAARIGCLANASNRRQRSVDQPDNGPKLYPIHGSRERIPPKFPRLA
jgi:hypothetical protein